MSLVRPWLTMAMTGSSLTSGRFARWVPRLDAELRLQPEAKGPIRIHNLGQGGQSSDWILSTAVPRIIGLKPTHTLIEPGAINACVDLGSGPYLTRAQHIANIQAIVAALQAGIPGVDITLQTMSTIAAANVAQRPAYPDYVADEIAVAATLGVRMLNNYAGFPSPLDPMDSHGAGEFVTTPTAGYGELAAGTVWNAADKAATIVLSADALGAVAGSTGNATVRATTAITGQKRFEARVDVKSGNVPIIGVANATASLTNFVGVDGNGLGLNASGDVIRNNAVVGASGLVPAAGDTIGVEVDRGANLIYFLKGGFRSAGFDISGVAGDLYPAVSVIAGGTGITARFNEAGDGLHLNKVAEDAYLYPNILAWGRDRAAEFWAA